MNHKLYKLHQAYGKHAFEYTGYCCGPYKIMACGCGCFAEQHAEHGRIANYADEAPTEARYCMSETFACLPAALKAQYKVYAAKLLGRHRLKLQLRGSKDWRKRLNNFRLAGLGTASKLEAKQC